MIQPATLQPRKFTVRRVHLGQVSDARNYHQFNEVDEVVIAHIAFSYQTSEGFGVQFYRLTPDGIAYLYKSVAKVVMVDEGTPLTEDEAANG